MAGNAATIARSYAPKVLPQASRTTRLERDWQNAIGEVDGHWERAARVRGEPLGPGSYALKVLPQARRRA